jgi:tRNA_anti-like
MAKKILVFCFALAFVVFVLIAANSGSHPPSNNSTETNVSASPTVPVANTSSETPVPALAVSALKLYLDYQANEVAADNVYKGKQLEVTGMVTSIRKDFLDNVILEMATTNEFESVDAYLVKEDDAKAASLQKGNEVMVICEGGGMTVGSPMLRSCSLRPEHANELRNDMPQPQSSTPAEAAPTSTTAPAEAPPTQ